MCEIRVASADDAMSIAIINREIHRLHVQQYPKIFKSVEDASVFEQEIVNAVNQDGTRIYVTTLDDHIVGYCWLRLINKPESLLYREQKNLNIHHFGVLDKYQNQGIGTILMNKVIEYAKESGVDNLLVDAWALNAGAISFYKKCGFDGRNQIMWVKINNE